MSGSGSKAASARPSSSVAGIQRNPDTQRNRPTSADWTRGHEVHMEGREPFEVWRSGLHSQIASLEKQMDTTEDQLDECESDGEEDMKYPPRKPQKTDEAMVRPPSAAAKKVEGGAGKTAK